ncbi:uncharacterized protein LOC106780607 [Vigna radiata var. radiata]|uniref:Uncharacterized protein LOC106780607 n=1 Tax=Vigna radiata var. radiata TaxID=3916 RepID=A0A3Q0EM89_VIGRR|nr:uncharacterized protein LOC106780607 [Vigna radiata var. radiata]
MPATMHDAKLYLAGGANTMHAKLYLVDGGNSNTFPAKTELHKSYFIIYGISSSEQHSTLKPYQLFIDDELDNLLRDEHNDADRMTQSSQHVIPELYEQYHNGYQWRLRAGYSKVYKYWEIKNIEGQHTCFSNILSQDHISLDNTHIATIVSNSVRTNPSIPIKSLITDIKARFGYFVSYRKAWIAKQKALSMEFGDWEEFYNHLPRWLHAVKEANPGTILQCTGSPMEIDGQTDNNCYIMERVFWSFGPCIQGFKYCKPILQVDGTFLTGKYHGTLLTDMGRDGYRNIFPVAFAIVEGETKEAMIWFFQLLREHVCPQQNICIITDRGKGILSASRLEEVGWEEDVNTTVQNYYIVTAYKVKQNTVTTKLTALRHHYPQQVAWIDKIPLKKWSQAFDGGRRYGHMTTNLVECVNSVLKGARSLLICALIRTTFERTQSWFLERGLKAQYMLQAGHQFPEEITEIIRKN